MSIVVDPNAIYAQNSSSKPKKFGADDFSATMSAIAPGASEAMYQAQGYNSAAVTNAAITGVAGASGGYGYGSAYGSPLLGGASGGGLVSAATNPLQIPGVDNPSQSAIEGQYLLQAMNDSNTKNLILQVQVQDLNREFTTLSNVLQSKHQTEINAVRNMRVG